MKDRIPLNEIDMENFLELAVDVLSDEDHDIPADCRSFEEKMILTNNRGLVVRFEDESGETSEFQITIVRSK